MTDDPDAPETHDHFLDRMMREGNYTWIPDGLTHYERAAYETLGQRWKRLEKEKAERRRAREKQERETTQLLREQERRRERQEERERRDPTPIFQAPDYPVSIPYSIRDQHIYVPGGTRRGKSTQLLNIIMHDIMEGQGVAVLDPKRDLLRSIVHALPAERMVDGELRAITDDLIYLDINTPIPLNLMDRTPGQTDRVVNDLVYIVTKGDSNLSAAEPLLDRTIRTLLLIPGATLTDVYRFLAQKSSQKDFLDRLKQIAPDIHATWDPFPKEGVAALERRMAPFFWNDALKAIFDSQTAPLDFSEIMDNKKILLVDLSPPGEKNTSFYGSLIMAQIMSAVMRRAKLPKHKCVPFFLHVDEFEFFQTESFARILSVAGGLGLRLTIGNQYLGQVLPDNLDAILGNAGTYIFFQISQKDAANFDSKIAPFRSDHLVNLKQYQACFKVGDNPPVFKWTKRQYSLTHSDEELADRMLEKLRENTVVHYRERTSAENSTKRTVDNTACNIPQVRHSKEDEEPTPGAAPSHHISKATSD